MIIYVDGLGGSASRNNNVRVSVVVPTQNRAGVLTRAIESVLQQTFRDLEVIIIDDASRDQTPAVLARFAASDQRVHCARLEQSLGASAARNRGIRMARGEYVAFLDDDDEWLPAKLERQLACIQSESADLVYSPYFFIEGTGKGRVRGTSDISQSPWRGLLRGNVIATPTVLVRRDVLLAHGGFDESLPRLEDWELWLRFARKGKFCFASEPLVRVHSTPASLSSLTADLTTGAEGLLRKHRAVPLANHDRADLHYALGHALINEGVMRRGRTLMLQSLMARPWPPQRFAMFLSSLFGQRGYRRAAKLHATLLELGWGLRSVDTSSQQ